MGSSLPADNDNGQRITMHCTCYVTCELWRFLNVLLRHAAKCHRIADDAYFLMMKQSRATILIANVGGIWFTSRWNHHQQRLVSRCIRHPIAHMSYTNNNNNKIVIKSSAPLAQSCDDKFLFHFGLDALNCRAPWAPYRQPSTIKLKMKTNLGNSNNNNHNNEHRQRTQFN